MISHRRVKRGGTFLFSALLLVGSSTTRAPASCCAFTGPTGSTCVGNVTQAQCTGELGSYSANATCNPETGLCVPTTSFTPTPPPAQLHPLIATNRGCLENGDPAVFAVGESIDVFFEIESAGATQATATILDRLANSTIMSLFDGSIQTNASYALSNLTVGPPTGMETLQLQASAPGAVDQFDQCTFEVVAAPSPTATPTPTPSATPAFGCCQFTAPAASCALVTNAAACDGAQFLPGKSCNAANGLCDGFALPTATATPAQRQLYFEADDVHDGGQITVTINVFPPGGGDPIAIPVTVTVNPGDSAETIAQNWAMAFQNAAKGKVNCTAEVRPTDSPNVWCVFLVCYDATSIGVGLPSIETIPNGTAVGPNVIFITATPSNTRTRTPTRTPLLSPTARETASGTPTPTITGSQAATPTRTATATASETPTSTDTPTATQPGTPTSTATATLSVVHMDLEIYRLDGSRLPDDEGHQADEEETVGSMVCINNDNDNNNAAFDLDEQNVMGENDLIRMVARRPPIPADGTARLVAVAGGERVKVWTTPQKTAEIELPATFDVSQLPMEFWVEGRAGSAAQRDVVFELQGPAAPNVITVPDRVSLTVIQITQTAWVGQGNSLTNGNALDADPHDPHWPGAVRVFPDARARGGAARDVVTVRVTLSVEPVEDWNVYLRAFDVDDPAPLDPDVDPNDNGDEDTYPNSDVDYTADEDNRGEVDGHKAGELDGQDGDGIATLTFPAGSNQQDIDFQVTMQPGDNFRVAAVCDRTYLPQLRNRDQDDHQDIVDRNNGLAILNADMQVTPVLTVWRRVHVERDSMEAIGDRNTVTGHITAVVPGAMPGTSIVTTDQNLVGIDEYECPADRFPNPCRLAAGGRQFSTIGNTTGPGATVTVTNDAMGAPPNDVDFTLHDDDNDAILPRVPDTGWMQDSDVAMDNLYAAAYIRPIFDGGGNPANDDDDVTPTVYTPDADAVAQIDDGKNVTGDARFWVSYLQSVFQGNIDAGPMTAGDRDPDDEAWELGFTPFAAVAPLHAGDASIIYQENINDLARDANVIANGANRQEIERATVVHEVGHQFNAEHPDLAIMDGGWPTTVAIPRNFSNGSLNRIRTTIRPGGGHL